MAKKSYFITIEGIEGAGKSTAMQYLQQLLVQAHIPHCVTREPGGTEIAEEIRHVLLKHYTEVMGADTELLLMFASRAQHIARVILPALQTGQWVLCDRFTDATYAYQGGGRGILPERILQIEQWVQGGLRPDYVFLLDVPAEVGLKRIKKRSAEDRIEQEKSLFFERVRQIYLSRASAFPARYKVIDASLELAQVQERIRAEMELILTADSQGE
ncbi:MAG TPA: dTMP kinase [Gammaproteobacteria bacterium]|nr:dTMP kinase [Gammaproteobacteria bacterium]